MLYRMLMRADVDIREWELNNSAPFDTAKIGSSALLAALKRNLRAELACWLGEIALAVFNDFEKFFDSLDIPKLLEQAVLTSFPPSILSFLLQQHLAPRVIQASGFTSEALQVFRSIIAGCKSSVALTRVYLRNAIKEIDDKHPDANVNLFVDDTCMQSTGKEFDEALDKIVPAVALFGNKAAELGLGLSAKAVVTASSTKYAKGLKDELATYGMKFNVDMHARDVGVTHTAGSSRPSKQVIKRFTKRAAKVIKTKQIAKITRKARTLFTGSIFSSATWGHQASSIAESSIVKLERDALACSGIRPGGRCRTIGLLVAYGVQGTPRARIVRELIRAWFQLLRMCSTTMIGELRVAWSKAYNVLRHDNVERHIRGIMSNLISMLLKAKWDPSTMNCWTGDDDTKWVMSGTTVSPDTVAAALNRKFFNMELARAAGHYLGKGLENGLHVNATLSWLRNIRDNNSNIKAILETLMAGAIWPAMRVNEAYPDFSPLCPRCGQPEDALHCFWTCPANCNIEDHDVSKTQSLVAAAQEKSNDFPALWLRGLLPANFIEIPPEASPVQQVNITYVNPIDVSFESGLYYGDASGGEFTQYPDIRRVGVSFVQIRDNGDLTFAAHFPLPGDVQTVARGELYALLVLIRMASPGSIVVFVTDNKGVYDKYNSGPTRASLSSNCDLYYELFQIVRNKQLKLTVRWMPSHLADSADATPINLPEGISQNDVIGNRFADLYAKEAAKLVQVPLQVSTGCIYYYNLVKNIQKRLVAILQNLPDRKKISTIRTPKEIAHTLDQLITDSRHDMQQHQERLTCTGCLNSFSRKDSSLPHFLSTNCNPVPSSSRPVPIDNSMHVGNKNIHNTHSLTVHRGLVYCSKCGCRKGKGHIRRLALACAPPRRYSHGDHTLRAINNDRLPPGLDEWPQPSVSHNVTA